MSAGFYLTSGFLYLNMGCEMMFVLSNRMKAQNIEGTTGSRILGEVIKTLCKPEFIEKILKPQVPISIPTFFDLFSKIVNSSSMKLDKNSMEKLFYLILMTFKKQVFLCSSPLELYSLTKIHLEDLMKMNKTNPAAVDTISKSLNVFENRARHFTFLQYVEVREELLSMLESYKSKIVLFVEVGMQGENGEMIHFVRHSHVQKQLGMAVNHPCIDFSLPPEAIAKKRLQYKDYLSWKTDLGKDDYDNIRGSRHFAESKKQEKTENERSINDLLGLNNLKLQAFQVHLDIFEGDARKPSKKKAEESQSTVTVNSKLEGDIMNKINKEFSELEANGEDEGEVDLLEMMDD